MSVRSSSGVVVREFRLPDGTFGKKTGEGPMLVLLHGVGLEQSMWQWQIETFAGSRCVVTYDLLGHGQSAPLRKPSHLDDFTAQLERLWVAHNLDGAVLLGFSFGGMIAQDFAIRHSQRVGALVLLSCVFDRSQKERAGVHERLALAKAEGPDAIYGAALERWFSPEYHAHRPAAVMELDAKLRKNDPRSFLAAYETFATADQLLKDRLSSILCPTLVLTGERDANSTPDMARRMANLIPRASVSIIPGGRHMMAMELPDEVNSELARFLQGQRPIREIA